MNFAHATSENNFIPTVPKLKLSQMKLKNAVKVPGFNKMNFIAGQEVQTTKLHNPIKNICFFKISIILDDDTTVWTSDLIAPGEKAEIITLSKPLEEGIYDNVTVKYDCISLNKKARFNSAKIKIKLIVEKRKNHKHKRFFRAFLNL